MTSTYDELADGAERGDLAPIQGTVLRGQDAAAFGRQMLIEATGASDAEAAVQLALGRPRVGEHRRGPSPVWNVRVSGGLDQSIRQVAAAQGVGLSTIVRAAVASYVQDHARPE